jgi:hypothetical protein
MRIVYILLFVISSLIAKSQESCYTVQLVSVPQSDKNLNRLQEESYPKNCKLMEIGKTLTVRCGCFEKFVQAQEQEKQLLNEYKEAVVATTYKYRFDDNAPLENSTKKSDVVAGYVEKKNSHASKKKIPQSPINGTEDDEELRLMLQVFLAKTDLESAFIVAQKGYEKNPKSYYWNQKMAEVCRWTNRSARSMKHLRIMYEIEYDPKIEQELIDYGSEYFQYEEIEPLVVNRAKKDPSEENIDLMILVFKKIGSPEKVVDVLDEQYTKDSNNTMLLTKALELSLEIGDLDLAQKYVSMIEALKPYAKRDAVLISKYYYVTHRMQKAYDSLEEIRFEPEPSYSYLHKYDNSETHVGEDPHVKYYQLKSDLGWYLQDNLNAADAAKHLMLVDNKARLVDYERISFVYQEKEPKVALEATRRAYKEYKLSYLFYTYANGALNSKNYGELNELLVSIDKEQSPLVNEALYWVIKSKVYAYYKQKDLEKWALLKAYDIESENYRIKLELLWFYMDVQDSENVQIILQDMAEGNELDESFYLPMASGYFYLQDINRASYYTQELLSIENPVTKLLEFKFLQAYIYQVQNNEPAFMDALHDVLKDLKAEAKKNPTLKKEDAYLLNYLNAGMYVWAPDKFEKRLKKAKKYLLKKNYDEISYSWAMKNSAIEKSFKIYYRMSKKEQWVQFSHALNMQEHTEIENLLDFYLDNLAMGDASQAAYDDGQKSLAQRIVFEGFMKNDASQNAYIQHMDLSKERSDLFDAKTSYYKRTPLLQKYIELSNRTYMQDGYYLYTGLDYYKNATLDTATLVTVPSHTIKADVGLRKIYDRAYLEAHVELNKAMKNYIGYSLIGNYRVSTDLTANIEYAKNKNALESTQLFLGGKRDMLSFNLNWQILNSTSVDIRYEFNNYSSQDEVNLGDGKYWQVSVHQQIRNGYPDILIGAFYDNGIYSERSGSKGIIDELQAEQFEVLPQNFYNVGVSLSYGMTNSQAYTRVWRPYFEVTPYYNSDTDDYTYGFTAGYGGKVFHQDHLVIGTSYTDSVSGVGGSIFELFLKYQFMYYHP